MIKFYNLPIDGPLRITSKYGKRSTGISGASTDHHGVDLGRDKSKSETKILAVAPGKIVYNGWHQYRGWYVVIQHDGFQTLSQHMKSKCPLSVGMEVKTGQALGIMGNSSDTSVLTVAVHLHFAVCQDFSKPGESGRGYEDPTQYLTNIQAEEEDEDMDAEDVTKLIKEAANGSRDTPSSWAEKPVKWAVEKGYISDSKNLDSTITKEELATVLYRMQGGK